MEKIVIFFHTIFVAIGCWKPMMIFFFFFFWGGGGGGDEKGVMRLGGWVGGGGGLPCFFSLKLRIIFFQQSPTVIAIIFGPFYEMERNYVFYTFFLFCMVLTDQYMTPTVPFGRGYVTSGY